MNIAWVARAFWHALALTDPLGVFEVFTKHSWPLPFAEYVEIFQTLILSLVEQNVTRVIL